MSRGKEGYKTSDGKDFRIGRPKEKPQIQEISVEELICMLKDSIDSNNRLINQLEQADNDSSLRVKCWLENGQPRYSITKKGLIGFRR